MKKYYIRWEFPHPCILPIFTNSIDVIYWIDPDGFRKNWFFIIVNNENREIIDELTPSEFYKKIDFLLDNGWYNIDGIIEFLHTDIKTWVYDFANKQGISLI
jgi:hypothetical protein